METNIHARHFICYLTYSLAEIYTKRKAWPTTFILAFSLGGREKIWWLFLHPPRSNSCHFTLFLNASSISPLLKYTLTLISMPFLFFDIMSSHFFVPLFDASCPKNVLRWALRAVIRQILGYDKCLCGVKENTYLNSSFAEGDSFGQVLTNEGVGVVGPFKHFL